MLRTRALSCLDGCAGRPARGGRGKSVTVKEWRTAPAPSDARAAREDRREAFTGEGVGRHVEVRNRRRALGKLRRRPGGRRIRFTQTQRYAKRLPKGRKAQFPGDLVQIDTLFVNVRPDKAIKHFTAYDPVA